MCCSGEAWLRAAFNERAAHRQRVRLGGLSGGATRSRSAAMCASLDALMSQIASADCHFVLCIRPNRTQQPASFEREYVLEQLRCMRVPTLVECVHVARQQRGLQHGGAEVEAEAATAARPPPQPPLPPSTASSSGDDIIDVFGGAAGGGGGGGGGEGVDISDATSGKRESGEGGGAGRANSGGGGGGGVEMRLSHLINRLGGDVSYRSMRGLLKKKGSGARLGVTTWHWRYCVLHSHALAVHEGKDRPKALRSSVPLAKVLRVELSTNDEAGGRSLAFSLHTAERTFVFCCLAEVDLRAWVEAIQENMMQAANLRERYGLSREGE
jgi:hypothetical protein